MTTIIVAAIVTVGVVFLFLIVMGIVFTYPWLLAIPSAFWLWHHFARPDPGARDDQLESQ